MELPTWGDIIQSEGRLRSLYQSPTVDFHSTFDTTLSDLDGTGRRIHAAYWKYDDVLRSLDEYFQPSAEAINRDARVDIRGPVHVMNSTLIRVEILAG